MMVVISNSSPIILFENIEKLNILNDLYKSIIIPEAVYKEIYKTQKGKTQKPDWIKVEKIVDKQSVNILLNTLGLGESEAIILAMEKMSSLLLIDDYNARTRADSMGLKITGVAGILLDAKDKGIIRNVKDELNKLMQFNYRIGKSLYNTILIKADEKG